MISIIIPAHRADRALQRCLDAVQHLQGTGWECVVADDGSAGRAVSAAATAAGFRSVRSEETKGPAAARNRGACAARGDVLLFLDADVLVGPRAVATVAGFFGDRPDVAALFGSYDVHPEAPGLVSQYKNLTHHYVHQHGNVDASTFWAGCGAVRRRAFFDAGGFDERYERPCIEDIELGYRLKRRGERIVLLKSLMVTHLKRWTWAAAIRSDIFDRGVPWVRLALASPRGVANDLNLRWSYRASVVLVWAAVAAMVATVWFSAAWTAAAVMIVAVLVLNRHYLMWLARMRGWWFAACVLPPYLLHHFCNGLSAIVGTLIDALAVRPAPRHLNVEGSRKP